MRVFVGWAYSPVQALALVDVTTTMRPNAIFIIDTIIPSHCLIENHFSLSENGKNRIARLFSAHMAIYNFMVFLLQRWGSALAHLGCKKLLLWKWAISSVRLRWRFDWKYKNQQIHQIESLWGWSDGWWSGSDVTWAPHHEKEFDEWVSEVMPTIQCWIWKISCCIHMHSSSVLSTLIPSINKTSTQSPVLLRSYSSPRGLIQLSNSLTVHFIRLWLSLLLSPRFDCFTCFRAPLFQHFLAISQPRPQFSSRSFLSISFIFCFVYQLNENN